jgi:2-amino-4-hydroxy-6-hydroxymethyldihydropteridine diphosphokinase
VDLAFCFALRLAMPRCLIALGSNLGERQELLRRALGLLERHCAIQLLSTSRWRETSPIGGSPGQEPFLNAAAALETSLAPESLLHVLLEVERQLGRNRRIRWGPRSIDLDLLLYDAVVRRGPDLTLPHPRMAWRRFVLEPAADVAPDMVHPTSGWTVGQLWAHLQTAKPYVAFADPPVEAVAAPARQLAEAFGGAFLSAPPSLLGALPDNAFRLSAFLVEYAEDCAQRLRADLPQWTAPLVVSSFWIDQSRALAEALLPDAERREFVDRWESLTSGIVRPKLLVVLDNPLSRAGEGTKNLLESPTASETVASYAAAIRRWARRPGRGPVLAPAELIGPDVAEAAFDEAVLAELKAAVEAMR